MTDVVIRQAETPADFENVRTLCWEYRDYLLSHSDEVRNAVSVRYSKANYTAIMAGLEQEHARPKGIIFLAEMDGEPVGCGMTHPLSDTEAEIKRVYVRPSARGCGVASSVSHALMVQARQDGYETVFLDTSRLFTGAQSMYEKLGFRKRGPYSGQTPEIDQFLVFYEFKL